MVVNEQMNTNSVQAVVGALGDCRPHHAVASGGFGGKRWVMTLVSVATLVLLGACGGGGGGDDAASTGTLPPTTTTPSTPATTDPVSVTPPEVAPTVPEPVAPPPAPPVATVAPDLVTSVSAPTYAAGTAAKGAWDRLLAQRSACGFGLLEQDTRLDTAAYGHAHYMVQGSLDRNVHVAGHGEDSAKAYFVGETPNDRAIAAGFTEGVTEIFARAYAFYQTGQKPLLADDEAAGAKYMQLLIESVYHAMGAFKEGRSVGVASRIGSVPSPTSKGYDYQSFALVALVGKDANSQKLGSGTVASWPCAGVTVVGEFYPATESPNPFADVTSTATAYGTPLYFKVDAGSVLVLSSVGLTKTSGGASSTLTLREINKTNDRWSLVQNNEVFFVPTTKLDKASTYTVNAVGTVDGVVFTRNFSFGTLP